VTIVVIILLGGLMHATRTFSAGGLGGSAGTLLAFGYVLLTAFFVGDLFRKIRLPRLTGYIVTGVVVGPAVLGLLSEEMVQSLNIVSGVAVSLIALTAGSELELPAMRPHLRTIGWISAIAVGGTTVLLALAVYLGRELLPFMAGLSTLQAVTVATVVGVVLVAQSPAVVVALTDEMRADGPVAKTVLGVVVIADLVVILLFAVASLLAKATLEVGGGAGGAIAGLAWEIFGSLSAGLAAGLVLALYLTKVRKGAPLFILTVAFVIAEVGQRLQLDPLLVSLVAGILIRNATEAGDALKANIEPSSLPVYIVFFAVAGATLHLGALAVMGLPAAALVLLRAGGLLGGTWMAARLAQAPREVQRYAGFGLVPQAGLAIALSLLFTKTFPDFAASAGALTLGVVAINELLAPVLYRAALVRSGEADRRGLAAGAAATEDRAASSPR
jgi:Kef-type K+ transport system membrane component KefB